MRLKRAEFDEIDDVEEPQLFVNKSEPPPSSGLIFFHSTRFATNEKCMRILKFLGILLILFIAMILLLFIFANPYGSSDDGDDDDDVEHFKILPHWDTDIIVRDSEGNNLGHGHFYINENKSQILLFYLTNANASLGTTFIINGHQSYYVQVENASCSFTQTLFSSLDDYSPQFNGRNDKNQQGKECLLYSLNIDSGILYLCMSDGYIVFGRYNDATNESNSKIVDFSSTYTISDYIPADWWYPPLNCTNLTATSSPTEI